MWLRVGVVWTDVSEERIASIFRVEKSSLVDFLPWRGKRYVTSKRQFTQDLHGATSQKAEFFKIKESHIHLEVGHPVPGLRFRNYAFDKEPRKSGPSARCRFTFRPRERSWDGSLGIAARLRAGQRRRRTSIPGRGKDISLIHNVQTGCGVHPASWI
jgi:hypothetical protein